MSITFFASPFVSSQILSLIVLHHSHFKKKGEITNSFSISHYSKKRLMLRFCCGCLSRRKRKSFPIHEKQRETEVTKVFIRHVETIHLTPPPITKKT